MAFYSNSVFTVSTADQLNQVIADLDAIATNITQTGGPTGLSYGAYRCIANGTNSDNGGFGGGGGADGPDGHGIPLMHRRRRSGFAI